MHAVLVAGLCVSYVRVPACALGAERAAACLFCCVAVQLASWLVAGGL